MSTTTTSRPQDTEVGGTDREIRSHRNRIDPIYYLFLFPALLVFTVMVAVPAVMGFAYSLTNSVGYGESEFIGLRNYIALFQDGNILSAYTFTLGFALVTVIVVNIIAFLLALGLTSRIKLQNTLRTLFVMPMVISGIIIAFVFQFLFSNTLPQLGDTLGSDVLSTSILANPDLAWVAVVFVHAWSTIPSTMLIYIAGLVTVPEDVYEAAAIDGASGLQRLLRITLPMVAGFVVINTIIGFKNYLNAYDIIVGLTDGGPGTATRSIAMAIFDGFDGGDYGFQMANAFIFFIISLIIAGLQLRLTGGKASYGS